MKTRVLRIFPIVIIIALLFSLSAVHAADNVNFPYTSGYCAVGEVDANLKIATILVETGEMFTVRYTGTAVSGDIHTYTYDNGTLTLAPVAMYKAEDGVNGRPFWSWWGFVNEDMSYAYFPKETAACFVYYSPTEWRVTSGTDMFKIIDSGLQTCLMMVTDFVDNGTANNDTMTARYFDCIMIVGHGVEGATERVPADASTTAFLDDIGLGWDKGDKIVVAANAVNCVDTTSAATSTEAPVTTTTETKQPAAPATGTALFSAIMLAGVGAYIAAELKKRAR